MIMVGGAAGEVYLAPTGNPVIDALFRTTKPTESVPKNGTVYTSFIVSILIEES
jgi:hypothetical protein